MEMSADAAGLSMLEFGLFDYEKSLLEKLEYLFHEGRGLMPYEAPQEKRS